MGRQIRFFATAQDYFVIFDFIVKNGWFLIYDSGDYVSLEQAKQIVEEHYENNGIHLKLFATKNGLKIVRNTSLKQTFLNTFSSEAIEIIVCSPPPPNIVGIVLSQNQYGHGRLWYEKKYYDDNGNVITKNAEVDKMYNSLVRAIKSKALISMDKSAYILPDAYRLYKEGRFIPCSGKNRVFFD